jgi:glycosyltransferase involved in cell wall biosynthesis
VRPTGAGTTRAPRVDDRPSFLFVTQYFPPERGAAQVRLGAITQELRRRGHRVEVVTAIPNYPLGRLFPDWPRRPVQRAEEDGIRVVRVWVWAAVGSGIGRVANYVSFGVLSLAGMARAKRAAWTVIEYPTLAGALPAVLWCRARHRRMVINVADLWVDAAVAVGAIPEGRVARGAGSVERWMLRQADLVNAVTEGVRDALIDKGIAPQRICWLPNGADTELFAPGPSEPGIRSELGADADEAIVLYAGTHGYVHGLGVVLDAAAELRNDPVRFVLVGGGSEKDELVARATRAGLDNVTFLDPVAPARVADYLRASTAGLATVRRGDLYRSIRSAKMLPVMASGRPLIYSGDDEGAAIVSREGAGIACAPEDGVALAAAVRAVIDAPERADAMGAAGRAWVLREASWQTITERWLRDLRDKGPATPLRLGFIGIHAGRRDDRPASQDENLAQLFADSGACVRCASAVRSPALRTLHQAWSALRWSGSSDAMFVTVFSGRSFLYADLISWLCHVRGAPTVLVLHGGRLPVFAQKHPRWVHRVLSRADRVVAPSPFLVRAFARRDIDVRCIPNVITTDAVPHRHRASARPRLLWMRTFHEDYDPLLALDVLAIVRETHPDVTLTMAGADHGLLAATRARVEELGLTHAVTFAGFLDAAGKHRAFEEHDLFVNTNRVDNMPVSILEVAAAGLVPVSTDAGGLPDLLTEGQDGRLVPVGDAPAMAAAICSLLDDPEELAHLGRGARALAERSSWPEVHRLWLEALAPLVS